MIELYLASGLANVAIAFYFKSENDPKGRDLFSPIVYMIAAGPFGLGYTGYTILSEAQGNE